MPRSQWTMNGQNSGKGFFLKSTVYFHFENKVPKIFDRNNIVVVLEASSADSQNYTFIGFLPAF